MSSGGSSATRLSAQVCELEHGSAAVVQSTSRCRSEATLDAVSQSSQPEHITAISQADSALGRPSPRCISCVLRKNVRLFPCGGSQSEKNCPAAQRHRPSRLKDRGPQHFPLAKPGAGNWHLGSAGPTLSLKSFNSEAQSYSKNQHRQDVCL